MTMSEVIAPAAVAVGIKASAKKQLLQSLCVQMARAYGLDDKAVLDAVLEREKQGSTGMGGGIAIPHGRLDGLTQIRGLVARLAQPVDFDALDGQPVDVVCLLLAPRDAGADYLKTLAMVSRLLRDSNLVTTLRGCETADALYAVIAGQGGHARAA
jgi:nitrogen PTS system EIIA component